MKIEDYYLKMPIEDVTEVINSIQKIREWIYGLDSGLVPFSILQEIDCLQLYMEKSWLKL